MQLKGIEKTNSLLLYEIFDNSISNPEPAMMVGNIYYISRSLRGKDFRTGCVPVEIGENLLIVAPPLFIHHGW